MDKYDSKYDAADFSQNPKKYELFQTAQIAANVFSHDGEQDLPEGKHVAIQYRCTAFNRLYRRNEPVYTIVGTGRDLYANTLKNFVL